MYNNTYEQIKEIIINCIELTDLDKPISDEDELSDIGINSLIFIKIVVNMEREFNIEFDDENLDFNHFKYVKDIVKYVEDKVKH